MSALDHHHDDGRIGPKLAYIGPRLITPMQPRHHDRLHLVLDDLELSFPPDGAAGVDLLAYRAERRAAACGWHDDHGVPLLYEPGEPLRALRTLWLDFAAVLRETRR